MLSPAAFHNPPGLRFPSVRTHQTVPRSLAHTPVGVMLRSSLLAFPGLAAEPFQIGLFVEMLPERVEVEGTGDGGWRLEGGKGRRARAAFFV